VDIKLGIPDDSPENTVRQIKSILAEEAKLLGASFECEERRINLSNELDITVELNDRRFNISLLWVHSSDLPLTTATIGNGCISSPRLDMELLHGDPREDVMNLQLGWNPGEVPPGPPFRWGLYSEDSNYMTQKPDRILDGALLRRLLRDALLSPPSRSS
jgi:hypothetical protein